MLPEQGCDSMLITKPENVTYLTHFTGDSSHLFIGNGHYILITDGRYQEQAKLECPPGITIMDWIDDKRYDILTYGHIVKQAGIQKMAFESDVLCHSDYMKLYTGLRGTELVPLTGIVEKNRMIKENSEVSLLHTACQISDKALETILPDIKPGISEMKVTALLEYQLKMLGADDISFSTIVLSGKRTSLLHGHPGANTLHDGDFLLFDFGALYKGYHADISRTFVIGKAGTKQKQLYSVIREAQQKAMDGIKDGIEGNLPDKIVRSILPEEYLPYYYPGIGHGVGLEIHEKPFIRYDAEFIFRKGMVITIEPGVYIPGWGGLRIEDTALVTDKGIEPLSHFPKELIEL